MTLVGFVVFQMIFGMFLSVSSRSLNCLRRLVMGIGVSESSFDGI